MILYYSPGACSIAPHIVLEELGLPFEARRVTIAAGEHRTPEYRVINPKERVPTLVVDGESLTEVPALLVYLASLKGESGLLPPPGSLDLARGLGLAAFLSSSLHIAYAQLWRPERFVPAVFSQAETERFSARGKELVEGLNHEVDERLASKLWALGDEFTVFDAYLFPFFRWRKRIGLAATNLPHWSAHTRAMLQRPAVQRVIEREGLSPDEWLA